MKDLTERGPNWCWDFVGIRHASKDSYLIEVKTSRLGKRKRGLKGNQSRRSRKGWTKEDIEEAKRLGFKLLLVNVQFIGNWKFEVSSRELRAIVLISYIKSFAFLLNNSDMEKLIAGAKKLGLRLSPRQLEQDWQNRIHQ